MKRSAFDNGGDDEHMSTDHHQNGSSFPVRPAKRRAEEAPLPEPEELYERMKIDFMEESNQERIVVLDFGAQYGKIIDRRVRECKVLSEMLPLCTKAEEILAKGNIKGIIISGGPASVYAEGAPQIDPNIFDCGIPVLGICYGFQLMNKFNRGTVTRGAQRADGQTKIAIDTSCILFAGLSALEEVLLTHGDCVTPETAAPEFLVVGQTGPVVAAIANAEKRLYGVQFHPEVDLTVHGMQMFHNFLFKICGCKGDYTMESREETCIAEINRTVGNKKVLVMVSGGVDSAVCAALLHKALGRDRITAIHIDTGFMREDESREVVESLNKLNMNVLWENRMMDFITATATGERGPDDIWLDNAIDPELKRQIIGNTFIRIKDDVMKRLKLDPEEYFFAQGTLRPDLIESASAIASGHADKIKTHHNDTELVRQLRAEGRVIEPLRDFHKDEVRELGASLGLPEEIVQRQPFPGPGLAIRIICAKKPYICPDFEATQTKLDIICNLHNEPADKDAENITFKNTIISLMKQWGYKDLLNQGFDISATLLPIKSVGVQGDCRSYSYVAALSTAQKPIPWTILGQYAVVIPKLLHNINRVCYVFGSPVKYPVLSVTFTVLNRDSADLLRKLDKIATNILFGKTADGSKNLDHSVTPNCGKIVQQMPVVMIPCHFDRNPANFPNSYQWSFVLRPFITSDFMTGIAALPGRDIPTETVELMATEMRKVHRCSRILLDLTSKPPGTTEWE